MKLEIDGTWHCQVDSMPKKVNSGPIRPLRNLAELVTYYDLLYVFQYMFMMPDM